MPYLQVDLDALDEWDNVAAQAGVPEGDVYRGCLRLWKDCFRKKTAHVRAERLAGFFPRETAKVISGLIACEFLDAPQAGHGYHVRGAERRLGLLKARSENGKRQSKNLRQFTGSAPDESGGSSGVDSEGHPERASESTPELTPSTQHPIKNTPTRARVSDAGDLEQQLLDTYQAKRGRPYRASFGDQLAIRKLLGDGIQPAEVVRRFGLGLERRGYPKVSTVAELEKHWNACAAPEADAKQPNRKGTTEAEHREAAAKMRTDENGDWVLE